jgi:hypothetical protein
MTATILVRVYDTWAAAKHVITELESIGVPSDDIGVASTTKAESRNAGERTEAAHGAGLGTAVGGGVGLLAGLGVLAIPGIGPVIAGGWLATAIVGAISGALSGGFIGTLVSAGVPKSEAELYLETVRRGATMITAHVPEGLRGQATEIMERYVPINVETRAAQYREQGWREFDPNAQPYSLTKPEMDRIPD